MTVLIIGMAVFLGVHSLLIVAPGARDLAIGRIGAGAYKAAYGALALIGFVLIVHGFALARRDPAIVYVPPHALRHLTMLLMLPVFPLLLAAYLPGRIKTATKHPMLLAVKTWAFAHLLANGLAPDVVLFGGFLAWAVADRISLKRRPPRAPHAAPARPWNDAVAVIAGLALYAIVVGWAHRAFIGVAPMG